mmetsp:Transcript_135/g.264  ORF Transcript_135/g.264 Transcript_135/m.264 type:complete len:202 (+) Transcript_135:1201-1806(+)
MASSFIEFNSLALTILRVASFSGMCRVTMSQLSKISSTEAKVTPICSALLAEMTGSKPITLQLKPLILALMSWPMLPSPRIPTVLPVSSRPINFFFSHLPARVEMSAGTMCRRAAKAIATTSSATALALAPGVFITSIPFFLAALMSMVLNPAPALTIILSLGSWSITAWSIFSLRTIIANASWWAATSSARGVAPSNTTS